MNFELNLSKCIKVVAVLIALLLPSFGWTQNTVGIGTETPNENAVLHLVSTGNNQGLLIPSMSTTQRTSSTFIDDLTTSDNGLLVFDLTEKQFYYWQDTQWVNLSPQAQFTQEMAFQFQATPSLILEIWTQLTKSRILF
jgi:hypothetical protein